MAAVGALVAELFAAGVGSPALYASLAVNHLPVAVGEGVVTIALFRLLSIERVQTSSRTSWTVYGALLIAALVLAPLASAAPDALEGTLSHFHLLPSAPNFVRAPWVDYQFTADGGYLSTLLAALAGLCVTLAAGSLLQRAVSARGK